MTTSPLVRESARAFTIALAFRAHLLLPLSKDAFLRLDDGRWCIVGWSSAAARPRGFHGDHELKRRWGTQDLYHPYRKRWKLEVRGDVVPNGHARVTSWSRQDDVGDTLVALAEVRLLEHDRKEENMLGARCVTNRSPESATATVAGQPCTGRRTNVRKVRLENTPHPQRENVNARTHNAPFASSCCC